MQEGPGARVNRYGRLIAATHPTTRVPESHKGEFRGLFQCCPMLRAIVTDVEKVSTKWH